jgi:hypothetical protein
MDTSKTSAFDLFFVDVMLILHDFIHYFMDKVHGRVAIPQAVQSVVDFQVVILSESRDDFNFLFHFSAEVRDFFGEKKALVFEISRNKLSRPSHMLHLYP